MINKLIRVFFFIGIVYFSISSLYAQINPVPPLPIPDPVQYEAVYDMDTGKYILYPKIGNTIVGNPIYMTPDEYTEWVMQQKVDEYYREKSLSTDNSVASQTLKDKVKPFIPTVKVKSKIFETIFGGNKIELIPSGYAAFDLGVLYQKIDNPQILPQNRKNFTIDLNQRIQLSVLGKVGENLNLRANYDTQAGFNFENKMNLSWGGLIEKGIDKGLGKTGNAEDRIIKKIEFGNVSMPLSTSLITGAEALFGIKGEFQFGKTYLTTVFSEQQSEAKNIVVQDGKLVNKFSVNAIDYEENQHYFLSQYFRDHYDEALLNYPFINSKINITKVEVWKIDDNNSQLQQQKQVLALRDIGESATDQYPDNYKSNPNSVYATINRISNVREFDQTYQEVNNKLLPVVDEIDGSTDGYTQYKDGEEFAFKKVRKLNESEYRLNKQLGYISLTQKLIDNQLLAVAFEYTINGSSQIYKVGDFSSEEEKVLFVKMLKSNSLLDVKSPTWDLMMKNVYNLEGSQISKENFYLNVYYKGAVDGEVTYLPGTQYQNTQLLKLLNWDRLNINGDLQNNANGTKGDGLFDFVPGLTIEPETGKVFFNVVEPFGAHMSNLLANASDDIKSKYIYNELYTQLKYDADLKDLARNYKLKGRFQGQLGGNGIPLGAINVPRGSVRVTAGGQQLVEGVDYIIDYQIGRINIINQTVKDSGVPINISIENQSTFNLQKKRFMGLNIEHRFNENFMIGATAINYKERPLTQKAQYGYEPVNNTIVGINTLLNTKADFLTRLTDKIPFINTDAESKISIKAEGAYLIPGENKAINNESYIDDFDETTARISLTDPNSWQLGSIPVGDNTDFPEGNFTNSVNNGFKRALSSWYTIDPSFYGVGGGAPSGVTNASVSLNMTRRVSVNEVFTGRDLLPGEAIYMNTFDWTIFPTQEGPYNYALIDYDPQERYSTITRSINVSNFRQANVENIEMWIMDPYADQGTNPNNYLGDEPELIIHLGNISEDVLKDGKLAYENGLPTSGTSAETLQSVWGLTPKNNPLVYSFSSEGDERTQQDTGYDGLLDGAEETFFPNAPLFQNPVTGQTDISKDNFLSYQDAAWENSNLRSSVVDRYRYFRNTQNNSPAGSLNASTATPTAEDANRDFNLDQTENYNQYRISLKKSDFVVGNNYIVDKKTVAVTLANGQQTSTNWYLLRIPVDDYEKGNDGILNNVRYTRMIMKGFKTTATLRFGTFDLVRNDWRVYSKYIYPNGTEGTSTSTAPNQKNFETGSVDVITNGNAQPPYVLPPGVEREVIDGTTGVQSQNEASLALTVLNMGKGVARGVYKYTNLDLRRYEQIKMFVHAEKLGPTGENTNSSEYDQTAKFFLRMGSDLADNYYEYEISLKYTPATATSATEIWPTENMIDIPTEILTAAKILRDESGYDINSRFDGYETEDPTNKKVIVKGRPSLGNITSLMIGMRDNGGSTKNVLVWANELRLSGIDNEGGYAANATINFNLGDFADVSISGAYKSVGFGAINVGPSQRSQDEIIQLNVNTAVNIDKFFPEKWGLKIPLTYNYSQLIANPKYNPLDNDIKLKDSPDKDKLKKIVSSFTEQRTIAIPTLRKQRTGNKTPKFYDVENLSLSFLYSDTYFRDIYLEKDLRQTLNMALDYNFTFKPFEIKPFEKSKFLNPDSSKVAKYLTFVKAINVNFVPNRISFRTDIARNYNEFRFRDINQLLYGDSPNPTESTYSNNFIFGWQYNIGYNLTKSLKFDFQSATRTLTEEFGPGFADDKFIWKNLFSAGRPITYDQSFTLNYRLPLEHFYMLDFITSEVAYTAKYNWQASSKVLQQETGQNLGNLAQNTKQFTLTGNFDFTKLLNRFKGYQKTDSITIGRQREVDSLSNAYAKLYEGKKKGKKRFKGYHFKHKYKSANYVWLFLKMFKLGNFNYNRNQGTSLPGFLPEPNFFGTGSYNGSKNGPTFGFLFGSQYDLRKEALLNGWLTQSDVLNNPFIKTDNNQITANIELQPINNLNINLNFNREYQRRWSQFGYNTNPNAFYDENSNFSITTISLNSSFKDSDATFANLINISKTVSFNLANERSQEFQAQGINDIVADTDSNGYADGYELTNADVLIPAFYGAYTGKNNPKLGYTKSFPLPNWRITYTGLKNIPFINRYVDNIEIAHSYQSAYTVNGIQSNLNYFANATGIDNNFNRYNPNIYGTVGIIEAFSPIIGADVTLRNNLQVKAALNKERLAVLSLSNYTMQEEYSTEYVIGIGYILKDVKVKLRFKGKDKTIKSDLNFRLDFSLRDNETRIRRILENDNQITAGQNIFSLKFSADYNFSKNINLKLFYDQQITKYKISTAFPLSTIRAGISATFNFGN